MGTFSIEYKGIELSVTVDITDDKIVRMTGISHKESDIAELIGPHETEDILVLVQFEALRTGYIS